ncbi:MAG: HAMP domain-containing protein [Saprospirales bacterium]|nr:HAMP domain-containing protein [Saprospirales bacterium]
MKLKLKLYLSLLLLFVIIVLLSGLGSYFLQKLAVDSRAIMQDNYQTLQYMQGLSAGLDRVVSILPNLKEQEDLDQDLDVALENCRGIIANQIENITEPGEKQLTSELQSEYGLLQRQIEALRKRPVFDTGLFVNQVLPQIVRVRTLSSAIFSMNEEALLQKNSKANKTAEDLVLYMALFGFSGVFFALAFILRIPIYFFKPLSSLNEGIKQIAAKNYRHQLDIASKDELGEIAASFNQMAQKLYHYNQSNYALLLAEKKRIDAVINQVHEGIIGIDDTNTVLFANLLACELLNMEESRLKGRQIQTLGEANDFIQSIATDLASGNLETKSMRVVQKGKEKLYSREIIPVFMQQPEEDRPVAIGFVVVLTDITSFSEKDYAKTQFIATISHELKTPIASIMMSLKLLKDGRTGALGEDQLELVDSIRDDSDRLLKIVGELLKMAQVETGNIQLDIQPLQPSHVVEMAVHALQQQAHAKGIRIVREMESDQQVLGDADKVTWVMINFLSNAIRYAPESSEIVLSTIGQSGNRVRFSVRDSGPGIDPGFQEKLFEKYFKVPGSNQSGTGLGLAISKEFIKAMGGSIGVESEPGKGSEFYFLLPVLSELPA